MRRLSSLPAYSFDGESESNLKRRISSDRRRSSAALRKRSSIRRRKSEGGKLTKSQEELEKNRNKLITEEGVEEGNVSILLHSPIRVALGLPVG